MNKKILLIDDSQILAHSIADMLKMEGFAVTVSHDGRHALSLLQNLNPDLVITDLKMPEMDGIQIIHHIRGTESLSCTPIIVLTADTDKQNETDSYSAGANLLMHKPFDENEFLKNITKLISNK